VGKLEMSRELGYEYYLYHKSNLRTVAHRCSKNS